MKRGLIAACAFLALLMLAGCGSQDEGAAAASSVQGGSAQGSSAQGGSPQGSSAQGGNAQSSSAQDAYMQGPGELRTLLSWKEITLCADVRAAAAGGFQVMEARRGWPGEDAAGTSLSFHMSRSAADETLQVKGFVYLGDDAYGLFDADDAEGGKDSANALLKETVPELLRDAGAEAAEEQAGGLALTYGFADEEKDGVRLTHLYAWAEPDGAMLYVSAEAEETGGQSKDDVKEQLEDWLLSFTVTEGPSSGAQKLALPFGEKGIFADDRDFLNSDGASLVWEAGADYLNASCSGSTDELEFDCRLCSAAAADAERIAAAGASGGETLQGALSWKIQREDRRLTASAAFGNDALLFEMTVRPSDAGADAEAALDKAAEWLKTVTAG